MFSTNSLAAPGVVSLRNPRRRQRNVSDESQKLPKAKRQRSALRHDLFEPVNNTDSELLDSSPKEFVVTTRSLSAEQGIHTGLKELTIQTSKKHDKRSDRSEGSVVLSSNDYYTVSQLPTLPDHIRVDGTVRYRAVLSPENRYALALTRTSALVWSYTSASTTPAQKDLFVFSLPLPSLRPIDPLPLGALVSKQPGTEPGLLVVIPSTGHVTHWETISNAEILGLIRQKQNGLQGIIPGMFTGEVVSEIISAEPAGFILSFSSGRIAQLSVRDAQGRPSINVRFFHGGTRTATGGLLGGLRNAFSTSSWKKSVASIHIGQSHGRGQRDVLVVSVAGSVEVWDTHWSNGATLRNHAEAGLEIYHSLQTNGLVHVGNTMDNFRILDFALTTGSPESQSLVNSTDPTSYSLLTFVALSQHSSAIYALVEIEVVGSNASVQSVLPIHSYHESFESDGHWRPKLCCPENSEMAFAVFAKAIVLASLEKIEPSPSAQLLSESSFMPTAFQDCIHFRDDRNHQVLGCALEDEQQSHKQSACLVMVQDFGLVRVALPMVQGKDSRRVTDLESRLSAKSRLEQAIFFGSKRDNPLDFVSHEELNFPIEEIEHAALSISEEILHSSSAFVPTVTPSVEQQLIIRAKALHDLAAHLKRHCPALPRLTRWKLLRSAERLAAQRAIWKCEEEILRRRKDDSNTILDRILFYMHERFKTEVNWDQSENDQVRHWLVHDTWRMEYIVPWTLNVLRQLRIDGPRDTATVFEQTIEATNLALAVLETGFRFREDNASIYGLEDEQFEDGVLTTGYNDLPQPWTCRDISYTESQKLLELGIQYCREFTHGKLTGKERPDQATVGRLSSLLPRFIRVLTQMHSELSRWSSEQDNAATKANGGAIAIEFKEKRAEYLYELGEIGLLEEGIALAEQAREMGALVELLLRACHTIAAEQRQPDNTAEKSAKLIADLNEKETLIGVYFEKYGESWGDAFFGKQVVDGHLGSLLAMTEYQTHLTKFLRKHPEYSKINWINEVVGEQKFEKAAHTLETLSLTLETNAWNKKVEICLSKLAQLAAVEQGAAENLATDTEEGSKAFFGQLNLIEIQQMLYEHIQPALHGAIDQKAELELAMDQFGQKAVEGKAALRTQLEHAFSKLISSQAMQPEEIISILTLMDPVRFLEGDDDGDLLGREFFYALRLIDFSNMRASEPALADALEQLIWRRCMIRDDWETINKTELKSDHEVKENSESTALFSTLRSCYEDGLWDGVNLKTLTPDEVLESPTFPVVLQSRCSSETRENLSHDLEAEKLLLERMIRRGRLGKWYLGLDVTARATVVTEANERGAAIVADAQEDRDIVMEP